MPYLVECFFYVEEYCQCYFFFVEIPMDIFGEAVDVVSGGSSFPETGLMECNEAQ